MRPFTLKSIEFERNEMVVYADTDQGTYVFPVLPLLDGQRSKYVTGLEKGEYVIRTREYAMLKSGNYGIIEEIRLAHEVCHYDCRVITPAYSTMAYFANLPLTQEQHEMSKRLGLDLAKKLENTFEDLFSIFLLKDLGYNQKDVEKAININPVNIKVLISNANKFTEMIKTTHKVDIKGIIKQAIPLQVLIRYPWIVRIVSLDHVDLKYFGAFVRRGANTRIRVLLDTYRLLDPVFFNVLKKSSIKISKKTLLNFVEERLKNSANPFEKLRWLLEFKSLRRKKIDFEESIKEVFIYNNQQYIPSQR